jgi:hypothetical protein
MYIQGENHLAVEFVVKDLHVRIVLLNISVSTLVKQHSAVELVAKDLHGSKIWLDMNVSTLVKSH